MAKHYVPTLLETTNHFMASCFVFRMNPISLCATCFWICYVCFNFWCLFGILSAPVFGMHTGAEHTVAQANQQQSFPADASVRCDVLIGFRLWVDSLFRGIQTNSAFGMSLWTASLGRLRMHTPCTKVVTTTAGSPCLAVKCFCEGTPLVT